MSLRDLARGQWKSLLPLLGVDARYLRNVHGPCPICTGKDRFRWDDQHGDGGYICGACGAGDGFALAMKVAGQSFQQVAGEVERILGVQRSIGPSMNEDESRQRNAMRRLWDGSGSPGANGPVVAYLKYRVGRQWPSVSLREHTGVFMDGSRHPALVAKVVTHDDRAINLHLTLLDPGGQKAAVEKVRRVMPGKLPDGCAVRLAPPEPVMGVAEGLETAMSASVLYGVPVWACLNAGLLSKWIPPQIAERVMVFADNDANFTGQSAAYQLAKRLSVQYGREVEVLVPPEVGEDWNDVHRASMPGPVLRLVK